MHEFLFKSINLSKANAYTNQFPCHFDILIGWGTDERAIISILGHRNAIQRKLIRMAYEEIYQEDLIKQLKSELSGDFEVNIYLTIHICLHSYNLIYFFQIILDLYLLQPYIPMMTYNYHLHLLFP
jgi:hypothetical protein